MTSEAKDFLRDLHLRFDQSRQQLLLRREERSQSFQTQRNPTFRPDTLHIRHSEWQVSATPTDLEDRRVEMVGPPDIALMTAARRHGSQVYVAQLGAREVNSWSSVLEAHQSLAYVARHGHRLATLMVQPRPLHVDEPHFLVHGEPISAALFDFGLFFFHNAHRLLERGSRPCFSLAQIAHAEEAAWWNEVFYFAQEHQRIPSKSLRAHVVIETPTAAFEMEEILFSLREHALGLSAGPSESPFIPSYHQLFVRICHRRGAHAIGHSNDKKKEAGLGFDGTTVSCFEDARRARNDFDQILGTRLHQKMVMPHRTIRAHDLWQAGLLASFQRLKKSAFDPLFQ